MTDRKLKTFEEKVNAFLKSFESGKLRVRNKDYFLASYPSLDVDEVEILFALCQEIEERAYQLACQAIKSDRPIETQRAMMQTTLETAYPYLDAIRIHRLISRKLYWANN